MVVFLTGEIQVGKSTIIREFLLRSGLSADGFMTYWERDGDGGGSLFLSPYSTDTRGVDRFLLARGEGGRLAPVENMAGVFDAEGIGILRESGKRDLVVMDELGRLESGAYLFQEAVMRHVTGKAAVLGVIKPLRTPFLDAVRGMPGVLVREVTVENRGDVLDWLLAARIFA